MKRRDFLIAGTAGVAAVTVGCAPSVPLLLSKSRGFPLRVPLTSPELTRVGGAVRIDPGDGSDAVYLRRVSETGFSALSMECMHLGCSVRVQGGKFRCPCHGSAYDLDGNVLNGPAKESLVRLRVVVEGDEVVVGREAKSEG